MEEMIEGEAYVLGDDVDTDQIIPAEYLVYDVNDPKERLEFGRRALSGVPLEQAGLPQGNTPLVSESGEPPCRYKIIIAGKNFGCGSSREHAPLALNVAGIKAVVAQSFARIFYRNSVNGGYLLPFESAVKLNSTVETGDHVRLKVVDHALENLTRRKTYELQPLGEVEKILEAGGVFEYARNTGMI